MTAIRFLVAMFMVFAAQASYANTIERPFDGFVVSLDCEQRGAVGFYYQLGKDRGHLVPANHMDGDVTPNVHPVAIRVGHSLLRNCAGEARGCVA